MTRSSKWLMSTSRLIAAAIAASAFLSAPAFADEKGKDSHESPDAVWSVPKVAVSLKPGETKQIRVTLTARDELDAGLVRVVPALSANLQVSPTTTSRLRKGQSQTFTLTFSAKIDAVPTMMDGVLQLRESDDKGRLRESIAKPLPIALSVVWKKVDNIAGVSFSYPSFGRSSQVVVNANAGVTVFDIQFQSSQQEFISEYSVSIIPNSARLPLLTWFAENIDPNGVLILSKSFVHEELKAGGDALFQRSGVPYEYAVASDPVAPAYAVSASGDSIVVIRVSQVNDFLPSVITDAALPSFFRGILNSLVAP